MSMKKFLLASMLVLTATVASSQTWQIYPQYGGEWNGLLAKRSMMFPTGCGTPVWASAVDSSKRMAALYYDSCNHRFWTYDPKIKIWDTLHVGSVAASAWGLNGNNGIDTRLNKFGTLNNAGVTVVTNNKKAGMWDSLQRLQVEQLTAMNDTASNFEIILIPDTQNEVDNQDGTGQAAGRASFQWIKDSAAFYNIIGAIGLGDITNDANAVQLDTADKWYDRLDDIGSNFWYVPTIGNHDYNNNFPATRNASNYLGTFGPSRIGAKSWYGGNYSPAPENFWINFDIMGRPFSVISLEFFPRFAVLAWADSLLDANPNRNWIYVTHGYLNSFGERSKDTSLYGNSTYVIGGDLTPDASGQEQWDSFVKKHKNISFVFNGHFASDGSTKIGYTRRFTDVGIYGNVVHQLFANWQVDTAGGNGYIVRLQFKPKQNKVDVKYFSPYKEKEDSRVESFTYEFPSLSAQTNIGILGNLSVNGEARFDGVTTFSNLRNGLAPYTHQNGRLKDTLTYRYNEALGMLQLRRVNITGYTTDVNSIPNLFAGSFANLYVNHPGGFGLVISRMDAANAGSNLTFLRNYSTVPGTKGAVGTGYLANIFYQATAGNGVTVSNTSEENVFISAVNSTYVVSYKNFGGLDDAGNLVNRMQIHPNGNASIGYGATTPNASATLDLQGTTRGFLAPRLTAAQRAAIGSPANGLLVYDTDSTRYMLYNGSVWKGLKYTSESVPISSLLNSTTGNTVQIEHAQVWSSLLAGITMLEMNAQNTSTGTLLRLQQTAESAAANSEILDIVSTNSLGLSNKVNTGLRVTMNNTGSGTVNTGIFMNVSGASTNNAINVNTGDVIVNSGNVGIGTTGPSEKLHLVGNFYLNGAFMPGGTAGTTGQKLVSAGTGTSPTWVDDILTGSSTQDGDGSTTVFNIPHGLSGTPSWFNVTAASSNADNTLIKWIDADGTNIIIHYSFAPLAGSSNLTWKWAAKL